MSAIKWYFLHLWNCSAPVQPLHS